MGAAKNNMIWDQEVESSCLFDEDAESCYPLLVIEREPKQGFVRKIAKKVLQFLFKETK